MSHHHHGSVFVVDIVNLMLHSQCVEWNCHFFSFSFVVFLLVPVLFACATYYMVNKGE